ncbi:MAG: hypothetical protein R3F11_31695 [Verrucomicrobiales bacterium]
MRVPTVTLEGELARLGWAAADVVKLDIEGHEYPLLAAAEPLFAGGAVGALLAEFHTSVPGAADGLPSGGGDAGALRLPSLARRRSARTDF